MSVVNYRVKDIRALGLQCKWSKSRNGRPVIVVRNPAAELAHQREKWWVLDRHMWTRAQEVGLLQAFDEHTVLGDYFGIQR